MNDRLKRILPLLADALPEFLVILIGGSLYYGPVVSVLCNSTFLNLNIQKART